MEKPQDKPQDELQAKPQASSWLKRIGLAGFLFFLIKGILWLVAFYAAGKLFK